MIYISSRKIPDEEIDDREFWGKDAMVKRKLEVGTDGQIILLKHVRCGRVCVFIQVSISRCTVSLNEYG